MDSIAAFINRGSGAAMAPLPVAPIAPIKPTVAPADALAVKALGLAADPVDILARTIWGEARGEGGKGMQAVANVICTRAAHPLWWGSSIITVCLEPWQFSCWNANDPNRAKMLNIPSNDAEFPVARSIARLAVAGALSDLTKGADSYFAASIPTPSWAIPADFTAQIGEQKFYRVSLKGHA